MVIPRGAIETIAPLGLFTPPRCGGQRDADRADISFVSDVGLTGAGHSLNDVPVIRFLSFSPRYQAPLGDASCECLQGAAQLGARSRRWIGDMTSVRDV